jgi:hypothetical protein
MRYLFVRSLAVALVLVSSAAASAQSLADVARREEERRKAVAKAGKVYTNDQLLPAPPVSTPRPAAGSVAATEPVEPEAPTTDAPAGDAEKSDDQATGAGAAPATEDAWRKRVAAERDAVSRAQILADALQSRINALTTDFENRGDPAQRSVIFTDRQKALAELDRVKKEIAEHQKAIITIQEEARRAGVPAGWTR